MEQTQTDPITYPSRIYDDASGDFMPNVNRDVSSDKVTTVLSNTNEVLGFKDGTSVQEMHNAIEADRYGSIRTYRPTFYDKFIRQPLAAMGMSSFQPTFISDIKPTPERAFATSMARAATADVFKPEFSDQEAKAYPAQAFAGNLVGSIAAFATGGALLDGWKLTQLTPFAESIIKGGILGGAYKGASETSNQLRDSDHPDLAKIGTAVLHDGLWWGGISGLTGAASKPIGVAASAGLGYLMAKSDGADEPSALLNGSVLAGFHMLSSHGDQQDVRDLVSSKMQSNIADYILAKNPLVHPIVADQAGRELISNYAQGVIERANQRATGIETPEAAAIEEKTKPVEQTGIETSEAKAIEEQKFKRPDEPFTDGYDPKMMDYLSQYIPARLIVRMSGTDRLSLANASEKDLEAYKSLHDQAAQEDAQNKTANKTPINLDVEKMINEGSPINVMKEMAKSKIVLVQTMGDLGQDIIGSTKQEGNTQSETAKEEAPQSEQVQVSMEGNDPGDISKVENKEESPVVGEEGIEQTQGEKGTSKIAKSIEQKAKDAGLTEGFDTLSEFDKTTFKEQREKADKVIIDDLNNARAIIRGDAPLPDGLKGISLIDGMERYLKIHPDEDISHELANSPLVSGTSHAAQETALAGMREKDSATAKLSEIKQSKVEKAGGEEKVTKAKKDIVKKAKAEMDKINLSKEELSWDKFLDGIAC